jgi:predicted TPR repeat methyltransferase
LRAAANEKLGKKDQAIADYRKVLALDPSDKKSAEGLKRLGAAP